MGCGQSQNAPRPEEAALLQILQVYEVIFKAAAPLLTGPRATIVAEVLKSSKIANFQYELHESNSYAQNTIPNSQLVYIPKK